MTRSHQNARLIGGLIIAGMVAGVFSVVPAIDTADYLTEAALHVNQTVAGALFQFVMAIINLAVAVLFYLVLAQHGKSLAIGFISLRVVAASLVLVGTLLLAPLLALSQAFVQAPLQDPDMFAVIGHILKVTRDHTNHGYMILVLCSGNILLYALLIKSRLVPLWFPICGLMAILLTAFASLLILFQVVDVISTVYLALNAPTALLELALALWLIVKGFSP